MDDGEGQDLAQSYDIARLAGQRRIQERWRFLLGRTRALLEASGFYSERGARVPTAEDFGRVPEHDIERLEYALGVLFLCARATLPDRSKAGAPIPYEARDRDVPTQCAEVLFLPGWRDPEFLRLGLSAIVQHELAEALELAGPSTSKSAALGCLGGIFAATVLFLSPAALASALVSASRSDLAGAVVALYFVGLCALVLDWAKKKEAGKDVPEPERRYVAWIQFRYTHDSAAIGAGAEHYLKEMATKGVRVPAVAIDLCAALRAHL